MIKIVLPKTSRTLYEQAMNAFDEGLGDFSQKK